MAKIGTQTKRLKANFLFSVVCADFVPEDDLIWNQEIYLFNHCARFSLHCLFIQKICICFPCTSISLWHLRRQKRWKFQSWSIIFSCYVFFNSLCGLRGPPLLQPTNSQESCAGLRWSPSPRWELMGSGSVQLAAVQPSCANQSAKLSTRLQLLLFIHSKRYLHLLFTFNLPTAQYRINISYAWFIVSELNKSVWVCWLAKLLFMYMSFIKPKRPVYIFMNLRSLLFLCSAQLVL